MDEPESGTVERWAWDFVRSTALAEKLAPTPVPDAWETQRPCSRPLAPRRLAAPGRPPELRLRAKAPKTRGLQATHGRARALHTFLHHELQAAELMAWAILAFPDAPHDFRRGLLRVALDEVRHMNLYAAEVARLGHAVGAFAVRDWFWERVPSCPTPVSFVATLGLGLESANLEHAASFATRFRQAGDEDAARVQEVIARDEIEHARFGVRWFVELAGPLDFARWQNELPPPLSPMLMRGTPLQRGARLRAGFPPAFLDELERWTPVAPGF
jgi:uncharacterized ferritin-like protein (DUF455 family)